MFGYQITTRSDEHFKMLVFVCIAYLFVFVTATAFVSATNWHKNLFLAGLKINYYFRFTRQNYESNLVRNLKLLTTAFTVHQRALVLASVGVYRDQVGSV